MSSEMPGIWAQACWLPGAPSSGFARAQHESSAGDTGQE